MKTPAHEQADQILKDLNTIQTTRLVPKVHMKTHTHTHTCEIYKNKQTTAPIHVYTHTHTHINLKVWVSS